MKRIFTGKQEVFQEVNEDDASNALWTFAIPLVPSPEPEGYV